MRSAMEFAKAGVLALVLASLVVSLPGVAAARHARRGHQERHRHAHRMEYVLRLHPASYRTCAGVRHAPVRVVRPPVPGYYEDRTCGRHFSSFEVALEHARRHGETRLVFVATGARPALRGGSVWGGWVRVSW